MIKNMATIEIDIFFPARLFARDISFHARVKTAQTQQQITDQNVFEKSERHMLPAGYFSQNLAARGRDARKILRERNAAARTAPADDLAR